MHIRLHELLKTHAVSKQLRKASGGIKAPGITYLDQIHLSEALVVPRLLDVENGDDVLVIKVAEQLHLSQCSQAEHGVVKGCDLLDGDLLA